jgi:hypothetical protein
MAMSILERDVPWREPTCRGTLACMSRLRYMPVLVRELLALAREHRAWWLVPLLAILALAGLLAVASQGALPFVYTLF